MSWIYGQESSLGVIISTAISALVLFFYMIYQWVKTPRCPRCGGCVVSKDIGLNIQKTECPECGVEVDTEI